MRRRLLSVALASAALVVVAFAVPLASLVRTVAHDRATTAAERDAAALVPVLALTTSPKLIETAIGRTDTGADGRIAVWLPDRTTIGDPTLPDPDIVDLVRTEQRSFSRATSDGIELYSPVVTGTGDVSVTRTRIPNALLDQGVHTAWAALAGVGLALIVVSAVVADRLARSLTRDADELKRTADRLAGGDPDARADRSSTPELDAAAQALNTLAGRINELRTAERERVADLSHRLRTPMTALRLDAERVADDPLLGDVDRLEAAVTNLIRTARRPLGESNVPTGCDAVEVTRERVDFWSVLADDDGRNWTFDTAEAGESHSMVDLSAEDLEAALDVLIGNVFAHTPDGTPFRVAVTNGRGEVRIAVEDAGPGLPDGTAERGASTADSTGLGISIAVEAAQTAGGQLETGSSTLGGASFVLRLPVS